MRSENRSFRLVVYKHQLDPHIFREILADKLNLNRTDAMRLVAQAPGIIEQPLSRRRAMRLASVLASVGVHVGIWPTDRLPRLGEPYVVHKVSCQADGLATFGTRGEPMHWIPWPYLELISVGEFPGRSRDLLSFGPSWLDTSIGAVRSMVLGRHRSGLHVRKPVPRSTPELWLVRRRPTCAVRIPQDQVNYGYLEDRRQPSARANFRQLIDDIGRLAPRATITPATQSFITYARPGTHQFASYAQFKDYTVWQLLVRWHVRSRFGGQTDVEP
jgi:hypothetical protein